MDETQHLPPGDLMVGADIILRFLIELGVLPEDATVEKVYYAKRSGVPVGNTGGDNGPLIASKQRLRNHYSKLARGTAA
jgi:hypothetical protein